MRNLAREYQLDRRRFVLGAAAIGAAGALGTSVRADGPATIRIGYQKAGVLPLIKQQERLEKRFASKDIGVKWLEFPFGPPLLEALNGGNLDYGAVGDTPPVFAQAAKANLLYVAAVPGSAQSEALIVPEDSSIRDLAGLKGRRIGFAKASSAHNTTVAALEKAGLAYTDITPVYLSPADAAAAFARGAIDAWTIWDPFLAIAQKGRVRILAWVGDVRHSNSFFLANRDFTTKHPDLVSALNDELAAASKWAETNRVEVADFIAQATGVDQASSRKAVERTAFAMVPVSPEIAAEQQRVADRFFRLGLIPKPIAVGDIIWTWNPNA
jgi:sulfonate transport system substrate-binding protein